MCVWCIHDSLKLFISFHIPVAFKMTFLCLCLYVLLPPSFSPSNISLSLSLSLTVSVSLSLSLCLSLMTHIYIAPLSDCHGLQAYGASDLGSIGRIAVKTWSEDSPSFWIDLAGADQTDQVYSDPASPRSGMNRPKQ